jgi:HSP20 family protein
MVRDLIPWKRRKTDFPASRTEENPFAELHRRMDDLFNSFFSDVEERFPDLGWGLVPSKGAHLPKVDISESDAEVTVTADLPGMDEKDISVTLDENLLTIRGERKDEREEKKRNYHLVERTYGEFHRVIPLPVGIDKDKVKASFKNGVLSVALPKLPTAKAQTKKIQIASS